MDRVALAHLLRAAARIVDASDILVLGSQSILGAFDASTLPEAATVSVEADLAFFDDPDEEKMDRVDGALGEDSMFHATHGYYAQGVVVATAVLPEGWRSRLIRFDRSDASPAEAWCLEPHDLVVAKLVANREKDREFATALLAADLIDAEQLDSRIDLVAGPEAVRQRVRIAAAGCARAAGLPKT